MSAFDSQIEQAYTKLKEFCKETQKSLAAINLNLEKKINHIVQQYQMSAKKESSLQENYILNMTVDELIRLYGTPSQSDLNPLRRQKHLPRKEPISNQEKSQLSDQNNPEDFDEDQQYHQQQQEQEKKIKWTYHKFQNGRQDKNIKPEVKLFTLDLIPIDTKESSLQQVQKVLDNFIIIQQPNKTKIQQHIYRYDSSTQQVQKIIEIERQNVSVVFFQQDRLIIDDYVYVIDLTCEEGKPRLFTSLYIKDFSSSIPLGDSLILVGHSQFFKFSLFKWDVRGSKYQVLKSHQLCVGSSYKYNNVTNLQLNKYPIDSEISVYCTVSEGNSFNKVSINLNDLQLSQKYKMLSGKTHGKGYEKFIDYYQMNSSNLLVLYENQVVLVDPIKLEKRAQFKHQFNVRQQCLMVSPRFDATIYPVIVAQTIDDKNVCSIGFDIVDVFNTGFKGHVDSLFKNEQISLINQVNKPALSTCNSESIVGDDGIVVLCKVQQQNGSQRLVLLKILLN
eukprot:403377030